MGENQKIEDMALTLIADDLPTFDSNRGVDSEFVLYSVDDDIIPRQTRRFVTNQNQDQLAVDGHYGKYYLYLATGEWSEKVKNTCGMLLIYFIPVLMIFFFVGALLTVRKKQKLGYDDRENVDKMTKRGFGLWIKLALKNEYCCKLRFENANPLRRLYSTVLSTAFYVFASLVVDSCLLLFQCGSEWLRMASFFDLRTVVTGSSAILCKIYPFVMSLGVQLSSWLTVVMAAETAWVYQRPQRLTNVCRLHRARRVLGGLLIALSLSNIHLLWTSTIQYPEVHSRDISLIEVPVCIDRLNDPRAIALESTVAGPLFSWDREIARLIANGFRFAIFQLIPYFIVFSCAVMLVTKWLRRRDQLRQVDNTWKACNIDASAGRQLHTAFAVLCVIHSIMLLPRLAFDAFQFITDPRFTGDPSVSYRPASVLCKTVVYILHYAFIAARPHVLLIMSPMIRRCICGNDVTEQTTCGLCLRGKSNFIQRNSPSSVSGDESFAGVVDLVSSDHVTIVGEPLLQKTVVDGNHGSLGHHVTFDESMKIDDNIGKLIPPAPPPPFLGNTASIVLENGAPCIKIFSMTSV